MLEKVTFHPLGASSAARASIQKHAMKMIALCIVNTQQMTKSVLLDCLK